MAETDGGGNWVLFWWAGPWSVNLQSNFLLMGMAVFPPCCLTWGQTMVEVMKIKATSFKKSHACTATLRAPNPAAGPGRPTPPQRLLDTHRQVWVSLLWGHCSFLPGPGAHNLLFMHSNSLFPQSCGSSVIKFHWPPKSNSLGILSSFARSPGWEICCGS